MRGLWKLPALSMAVAEHAWFPYVLRSRLQLAKGPRSVLVLGLSLRSAVNPSPRIALKRLSAWSAAETLWGLGTWLSKRRSLSALSVDSFDPMT